jgi:hypothetical protein
MAAAASVAGVAGGLYLWNESQKLTAKQIRDEIVAYHTQEEPQTTYRLQQLPDGYPLSSYVHRLPGTMWRPVEGFLHRDLNGVAFDMIQRGTMATLYAIPVQVAALPTAPPQRLVMPTGAWATAVWQEGHLLYVLVVHGDEQAYRSFIRASQSA